MTKQQRRVALRLFEIGKVTAIVKTDDLRFRRAVEQ